MGRDAVLHVVERWLPSSETFVHGLVARLRRPGVVVSMLPVQNRERFPFRPLLPAPRALDRLPARARRRAMTGLLGGLSVRYGAGIVHVHHGYRAYEVVGLVNRRRLPLVISVHGHDVTGHVRHAPQAYAEVLARADAVVVPSRFLADHAVAAGARPDSIRVIPAGVDTSWFAPSPLPDGDRAPREVLFVGRFVEKKGLDVLLDAWPSVRDAVPSARLRLLGFGPLEALARSAGPGTDVVVDPDRATVRDAMRRAWVVVTPSRTASDDVVESLLLVNLEAEASGRPVVTTDHGGIAEYVEAGKTALVVPERDADALASAVIDVLRDDALAARLGAAGPELAARFDVADCAAQVDALYDSLL